MIDQPSFERRVGALLRTIADEMPTAIDADAMVRSAATLPTRRGSLGLAFGQPGSLVGLALVVLALVIALVGGAIIAAARPFERDPADLVSGRVAPFQGLPPLDALPSTPETGEVVLRMTARIGSLGDDVHSVSLYADGRLIWGRSLEGSRPISGRSLGGIQPLARAMMEQRLTSEGVDLLLTQVRASTSSTKWSSRGVGGPGVIWGTISIKDDDEMRQVAWSDRQLPGRLADPGSWLPASAWADRGIRGFVPTRYAVCPQPGAFGLLPDAARQILASRGTPNDAERAGCYELATADATSINEILDRSGFPRADAYGVLEYQVPAASSDRGDRIDFISILPDGGYAWWGG